MTFDFPNDPRLKFALTVTGHFSAGMTPQQSYDAMKGTAWPYVSQSEWMFCLGWAAARAEIPEQKLLGMLSGLN